MVWVAAHRHARLFQQPERKGDANQWLVVVEGEMLRGEWIDPSLGRVLFGQYGAQWIEEQKRRLGGDDPDCTEDVAATG